MKLHYFNQSSADPDDFLLAEVKDKGKVPHTCLLGGRIVSHLLSQKKDPCKTCQGPRAVCFGTPQVTEDEAKNESERARIKGLLIGETNSALIDLLRRR